MLESSSSALTSLVRSDFLRCKLCSRTYTQPTLLPCLHTFCAACLTHHLVGVGVPKSIMAVKGDHGPTPSEEAEDSGEGEGGIVSGKDQALTPKRTTFQCPECKTTIPSPQNGLDGFQPNYFMMALVDLAASHKQQVQHECDYCHYDGQSELAVACCLECRDNMCGPCTAAHRRTKLTRHHQTVLFTELATGAHDAAVRRHQRLACRRHADQDVRFYCGRCQVVACKVCTEEEHAGHGCSDVTATGQSYALQTRATLTAIQAKVPTISEQLIRLAEHEQSAKEQLTQVKGSVEKQAAVLHKLVDKYKDGLLRKVEQARESERLSLGQRRDDLEAIQFIFKSTVEYLSKLLELGKPEELLGTRRVVSERLAQLACLQLQTEDAKLDLQFKAGSTSKASMESIFGKVELHSRPKEKPPSTSIVQGQTAISSTTTPSVGQKVELILAFECHSPSDLKDVWPSGLALDDQGTIFILDRENKKVKVYDCTGSLVREFGHEGPEAFGCPYDVTLLKDGTLAVSDYDQEQVKLFTVEGTYLRSITDGLKYPRGLAVNQDGHLLVLDASKRRVTIHDPESGQLLQAVEGKDDTGVDLFTEPYYLTTNSVGYIIVTDWVAPNVKMFDPASSHCLSKYGTYGSRHDQILQPYGVCTDSQGCILVADNQNHRVHLLAQDGRFLRFVVGREHDIWHPMALAINQHGHLVVTEALGKVKVFRYQ